MRLAKRFLIKAISETQEQEIEKKNKTMPIFLYEDESTKLGGKQIIPPQYVVDNWKRMEKMYSHKKYRNNKGHKRLIGLLYGDYNDPNGKKKNQNSDIKALSWYKAKEIARNINAMSQTPDNLEYSMIGGDTTRDWVNSALKSLRNSVRRVDAVPEVPKLKIKDVEAAKPDNTVKLGGTEITLESARNFKNKIRKKIN